MKWLSILGIPLILGACASEPIFVAPANQRVADFVEVSELGEVDSIRKNNNDSWSMLNSRYVVYRGYDDFLIEFRKDCREISNNNWLPPDYIHDHRYLRAGVSTIRGCIIEKIYSISRDQRNELRRLTEPTDQAT